MQRNLSEIPTRQLEAMAERRRGFARSDLARAEEYEAEIRRRSAASADGFHAGELQAEPVQDVLKDRTDHDQWFVLDGLDARRLHRPSLVQVVQ